MGSQEAKCEKHLNLFQYILECGECEDFEPDEYENFVQTSAPPGSLEKIEILRRRVETGQPLWHKDDRRDFNGCRERIVPRQLPQ